MDYSEGYKFATTLSPVFLKKIVPLFHKLKVLDLGCGQGAHLQFFGRNSLGIDLSKKNLNQAKLKGLNTVMIDLNSPKDLNRKFEAIFSSHLLEHVESPINLLRFAKRQLKSGGEICLSIPNERSIIHLKYPYFNGNGNHLYGFTVANIKELLKVAGFGEPVLFYDYYTLLSTKLRINKLLSLIDLLPDYLKTRLAWSYWFVAKSVAR